ncbi:MAG: lipopolysaccharide assembly protein LapB, partial [Hydrogenophaga sp.]|nr:lipopolysaccharide assembly protein LapB [Hydrogenophaga sp.]
DRAEAALHKLEGSAFEGEALLALLGIYERSRDWPQAKQIAQRLEDAEQGSFATRLAHYLCEEAELAQRNGDSAQALRLLEEAVQRAPQLARGWMALSAHKAQAGDAAGAFEALLRLNQHAPQGLPLAARAMADLARQTGRQAEAVALLQASHDRAPSIDITEALASLSADNEVVRNHYLAHLEREPSLVITAQWLAGETLSSATAQARVQKALEQASAPLRRYRCAACGFEARQHFWQCPGCQAWDSYPARRVEEL